MPDIFGLEEEEKGEEGENDLIQHKGKPIIDPDLIQPGLGPLALSFMKSSSVYNDMEPEEFVRDVLYGEVSVATDPDKYSNAARFIPGATMSGRVGPGRRYKVMVVGKAPAYEFGSGRDAGMNLQSITNSSLDMLMGAGKGILLGAFKELGLTPEEYADFYVTNVVRFPRIDGGKTKQTPMTWVNECKHYLQQELHLIQPDFILALGSDAAKVFTKLSVTKAQGRVFDVQITETKQAKVICAFDPRAVLEKFENRPMLIAGLSLFVQALRGQVMSTGERNFYVIDNEPELEAVVDELAKADVTKFAVDCEWGGGQHYLDGNAKLRTIQVAWSGHDALVVVLQRAGMKEAFNPYISSAVGHIRKLLCRPGVKVIGHNLAADFGWLYEMGIDLSGQFYFDTMLASHLFEPTASHDLDSLAVKLIPGWQRHDTELMEWKKANPGMVNDDTAYGNIPDEILHPYGANDACATYLVHEVYEKKLALQQYMGLNRLFRDLVMPATLEFIEMERTGIYMDRDRLIEMETQYRDKYNELLGRFRSLIGQPLFNPNSYSHKAGLLYKELKLSPVKTTGKYPKMWDEVVDEGKQKLYSPAVDDETLGILAPKSDIAKALQDICLISTVRKSFLTPKVLNKRTGKVDYKKGLIGFIKSDGRLHTQISQMLKTGRLSSHDPNLFNMPNQQEEAIQKAGGGGIYRLRSAFLAKPGHLIVAADLKQAEVCTLAYLSGDQTLIEAIESGVDIHSAVALKMFRLPCTVKEVKKLYKAQRVSSKSLVFGIIYGRGYKAVRREIEKAGVACTDDEAKEFIEQFMAQFPLVKKFIEDTQKEAEERHLAETLWGRQEHFYQIEGDKGDILARQKRQSVNFKIQSYVGDLLRLAFINMKTYKREHNLTFRPILSVYDSIMLEVPIIEVPEVADIVLPHCMTHAAPAPRLGFKIGSDVEVVKRWDVPMYLDEMTDLGLPEEFAVRYCAKDDKDQPKRRPIELS